MLTGLAAHFHEMSEEVYELVVARPAARTICEVLPENVATAVLGFITGALIEKPHRVGRELRRKLASVYSARRGTYRILYRIDEPMSISIVSASSAMRSYVGLTRSPGHGGYELSLTSTLESTTSTGRVVEVASCWRSVFGGSVWAANLDNPLCFGIDLVRPVDRPDKSGQLQSRQRGSQPFGTGSLSRAPSAG